MKWLRFLLILSLFFLPLKGESTTLPSLPTSIGEVMNKVVGFIALIVLMLAVFMFIYAGYLMVTSGGDVGRVEAAKSYLVYGSIGMGIAFVAWALMRLIGSAFGVNWGS